MGVNLGLILDLQIADIKSFSSTPNSAHLQKFRTGGELGAPTAMSSVPAICGNNI